MVFRLRKTATQADYVKLPHSLGFVTSDSLEIVLSYCHDAYKSWSHEFQPQLFSAVSQT